MTWCTTVKHATGEEVFKTTVTEDNRTEIKQQVIWCSVNECCLFLPSDDVSLFGMVKMVLQSGWGGNVGEGEVPLDDLEIPCTFPSDVEEDEAEEKPGF